MDGPIDIENAIIDKLGKNDIKWESLGEMHDPRTNRITYEEVIEDGTTSAGPVHKEEGSGPRMGAGSSKEGRYTLNMVKIDRKVREVISHIKLAEAKKHICKIR